MAASVVDGRETGFPTPHVVPGITPFMGNFTLASTSLDEADDKVVLFGPFPAGNGYIVRLSVAVVSAQGAGFVWDLSKGDLDGTIDAGGELIDGSVKGVNALATDGIDELDADNLMFDMSASAEKYLIFHTKTAGASPAQTVINVYGEYVAGGLKANVD